MPVLLRLSPPSTQVWYLAYGSNMSSKKFIHDRGITPLQTAAVTVPGWVLAIDSSGFPYSEPAFASISPAPMFRREKVVELIGTAYQLTPEMYAKVIASEGGGIAYAEVEVRAEGLTDKDNAKLGAEAGTVAVRSLITVLRREARPSDRYMGLLRTGAEEALMPSGYQKYLASIRTYHPPEEGRRKMGAVLFQSFWVPLMSLMEKITKASLKNSKDGTAPYWVIVMVRVAVFLMWLYHDYIHSPIWGRGDGLDQ